MIAICNVWIKIPVISSDVCVAIMMYLVYVESLHTPHPLLAYNREGADLLGVLYLVMMFPGSVCGVQRELVFRWRLWCM